MFGKSVTLFRLLGFDIKVDLSWVLIALLITWSLATSFFPSASAGFPVAVVRGSNSREFLAEHHPSLRLLEYTDHEKIVEAALAGKVRVFVAEDPTISYFFARAGDAGLGVADQRIYIHQPLFNRWCKPQKCRNRKTTRISNHGGPHDGMAMEFRQTVDTLFEEFR